MASLERNKFNNLVVAGGWDAYELVVQMEKEKKNFPYLNNVSIILLPGEQPWSLI